jgi:3-hydroxyacyl-[acyl-carrier-protein] dehydratase
MNKLKAGIINAALGPVEAIAPDKAVGRHLFPRSFIGFDGHFPGYPVLPAYVQVLTALTVIEEWKDCPFQLVSVEKAKFHIELRPDQEIFIQCREFESKGKTVIEANLTVAEGLAAVFLMHFEAYHTRQ